MSRSSESVRRVKLNLQQFGAATVLRRTNAAVYGVLSQGAALAQTMTPVDLGTLVNSQYAPVIESTPTRTTGRVGYTAEYAAAVHGASGKLRGQPRPPRGPNKIPTGDFWDPAGEPRFLSKGFEGIRPAIPAILKQAYRARRG